MKKGLKWFGILFTIMVVAVASWIGWFIYVTEYRIIDIDAVTSPNGQYTLLFQAVGEPDFPFGNSHARIILKDGKRMIAKTETLDVANDGGILGKENWDAEWMDDRVMVTLHGEEQEDDRVTLFYNGKTEGAGEL